MQSASTLSLFWKNKKGTDERNWRWHKQMERYNHVLGLEKSILLKWPYYPKQSTDSKQSLSNYQWHFFHSTGTNNFRICMETKKTPNSQSNLEKEKQSWRYHTPWIQAVLQSYYNQNSMGDFPGGAVVKNPPASAGNHRFEPWSGKIPHATEQLSLCATTTETAL